MTFLLIILGFIVLLLIIAAFMRKEYRISNSIILNAPQDKVWNYMKHLKNQDNFNKWVMTDPGMKRTYVGEDGTVGFVYGWNGNKKAGEGEWEIKKIVEGKSLDTEIRFIRPFKTTGYSDIVVESVSGNQTKILWKNKGEVKYPINLMVKSMEKMLGNDMEITLNNLKRILE